MLLISQPSHLHLSPNNTLLQKSSPFAVGDVGQAKSSMRKGSSQHVSEITIEPSESQQHCVSKKTLPVAGNVGQTKSGMPEMKHLSCSFPRDPFLFFRPQRGAWIKGNTSDAPPSTCNSCNYRNKALTPGDMVTLRQLTHSIFQHRFGDLRFHFPVLFQRAPFYFFGRWRGAEIKGDTSDAPLSTLNSCNYKHKTLTPGYLEGCRCLPAPAWTTLGWQRGPN